MPTFLQTEEQDPLGTPLDMGVEPVTPPQEQEQEDEPNVFLDIAAAPFRGLLGAVDNTYDLLDYTSNFISGGMLDLPDVNINIFGESKTWQGGLVQGISQFATGFIPFMGVAGKLGQAAKLGKPGKVLLGGPLRRATFAGAAADFTVFASNEARLSNLLQAYPALQNPVSQYLAADEDDTFIEGRLKNALEGVVIGGAFDVFLRSLKLHKAFTKARAKADNPEDIIPELLKRPDANELLDEESFIGPIRSLEAEQEAAKAADDVVPGDVDEGLLKSPPTYTKEEIQAAAPEWFQESDISVPQEITTEASAKTQIATTDATYDKGANLIKEEGTEGKTLDLGAGLGRGADKHGFDSVEPNPQYKDKKKTSVWEKGKNEPTYKFSSDVPDESYENILSINVLNVLAPDVRLGVMQDIGRILKEGGTAFVGSRGRGVYGTKKNPIKGKLSTLEPGAVHTSSGTYQKGYTPKELKEYAKSVLGSNFEVTTVSEGLGASGIKIRKLRSTQKAMPDPGQPVKEASKAADDVVPGDVTQEVVDTTTIVPVEAGTKAAAGDVVEEATALVEGDYFKATKDVDEDVKFSEGVDAEEVDNHIQGLVGKGIGRGGRPALSTTNDTYGYMKLVNKLVKNLEEVKPKTETDEEVLENARNLINSLPEELRDAYGKSAVGDDIATLSEIRNRITAFRLASEDVMADLTKVIKEQSGSLGDEKTLAIVSKHLHDLYEMSALESQVARQFGKGLRETKLFRNNKSPFNVDEIISGSREGAKANMRAKSEDVAEEVRRLIQDGGDPEEVLNQVLNLANKTRAGFFEMTREYYLQNLLGAVPTMVVNGLGGALSTTIDMFEKSIGALMTGNPELAKAVWKHAYDSFLDQNIWKAAGLSYKEESSRLMGKSTIPFGEVSAQKSLTAENIQNLGVMEKYGVKFDEEFAKKVDTVLGAFRYPFKVLTATDEVVRQLNARRAASYKAFLEAQATGLNDPKEIAEYVENRLRKVIDADHQLHSQEALYRKGVTIAKQNGFTKNLDIHTEATKYMKENFDPDTSALAQYGADVADELAFTKDLTKGTLGHSIYKALSQHPSTAFVVPFIKTPLNILGYSADRTLLALRNFKPFLDELNDTRPLVRNAAIGRLTTTISAVAGLVYGINTANREGVFHVSGGGPRDIERRKRLEETGWQAYSIKIGDKWVSYQRLDPFATIIGFYADIGDMSYEGEFNVTQGSLERFFIATVTTLQRNILNKSYLASLNQFMAALTDNSGTKIEKFLGSLGSNFIPASGLLRTTVGGIGAGIMGDHEQKELRNMGDYFLRTLPGQQGKLDPKRNLLGEVKEYDGTNYWRATMPINLSFDKGDVVMKEIAELDHGFEQVSPTYKGLVDLAAHRNRDGQSAHDRRLEIMSKVKIDGKTLRQSLSSLVRSAAYKKLNPRSEPGLPSPRIRMINSILAEYRAKSLDMALREFPELRRFQQQYEMARMQQRQGATIDNLLQTLEF